MQATEVPNEVKEDTIFVRNVPISQMFVAVRGEPGGYGRPVNERRVAKLAAEFEPQAVGVLLLSLREDGRYAIIDGQQRTEAAKRNGVEALDAYVYIDLSIEEEARLYRQFGDYLKQGARDRYLAAQVEGDPRTVAIDTILAEFGLWVAKGTGGRHEQGLRAVGALERIVNDHGQVVLRKALQVTHAAFGKQTQAYAQTPLRGMAAFIERYDGQFSQTRLVEQMAKVGLNGMKQRADAVRLAEGSNNPMTSWGKGLRALYNAGLRTNQLPPWADKVYSEPSRAQFAATLKEKALPASINARKIVASDRAKSLNDGATCPVCRALPGADCKDISGRPMALVHNERYAAARKFRASRRNGKH